MKIRVLTYADYLPTSLIENKVAVVIDVFRATSVITTALMHGAKAITVTADVESARALYHQYDKSQCILAGERGMHKIDGFDLDNSPIAYTKEAVNKKQLILTTTNGTSALKYCESAKATYVCSMLNYAAVAAVLMQKHDDVVIVCAGHSQYYAAEDAMCAAMLLSYLAAVLPIEIDDLARTILYSYEAYRDKKYIFLQATKGFKKLVEGGYEADVNFCLQENIFNIVPICINNEITAYTS